VCNVKALCKILPQLHMFRVNRALHVASEPWFYPFHFHLIRLCDMKCRDRFVNKPASYPTGLRFESHLGNELL
jgi:hypothetical protein